MCACLACEWCRWQSITWMHLELVYAREIAAEKERRRASSNSNSNNSSSASAAQAQAAPSSTSSAAASSSSSSEALPASCPRGKDLSDYVEQVRQHAFTHAPRTSSFALPPDDQFPSMNRYELDGGMEQYCSHWLYKETPTHLASSYACIHLERVLCWWPQQHEHVLDVDAGFKQVHSAC